MPAGTRTTSRAAGTSTCCNRRTGARWPPAIRRRPSPRGRGCSPPVSGRMFSTASSIAPRRCSCRTPPSLSTWAADGGELLGALASRQRITGIGVDLSTPAVEQAARAYPALTWVVANADRRLPLLDRSVDLVVSLHGRRSPDECARVLTRNGSLILGIPAHDDLIELRASVQGTRNRRGPVGESDRRTSAAVLAVVERFTLRRRQPVERAALTDLLKGTYRGARRSAAARVEALDGAGGYRGDRGLRLRSAKRSASQVAGDGGGRPRTAAAPSRGHRDDQPCRAARRPW